MTVQSWMYYNATAWEGKRPRANLEGLPPSLVKGAGSLTRPLLPLHASHGAPTHPPLMRPSCLPPQLPLSLLLRPAHCKGKGTGK